MNDPRELLNEALKRPSSDPNIMAIQQAIRAHQPEPHYQRLPCGCPIDSGCTGWHQDS